MTLSQTLSSPSRSQNTRGRISSGGACQIPFGHDPQRNDEVTRLYYFEHDTTDDNLIHVLEQRAERYLVRIEGTCTDVSYYDGSKPRTQFQIEAWFTPHISS